MFVERPATETEKLDAVSESYRDIEDFLDWVAANPAICLGEWLTHHDDGRERAEARLVPLTQSRSALLAEYFGIDTAKLEAERRALLTAMRQLGAGRTEE